MHGKRSSPVIGALVTGVDCCSVFNSVDSDLDDQKLKAAKKRVGKCPLCNEEHSFKSKWHTVPWPSDRFIQCKKFIEMSVTERGEALDLFQGCSRCTA